MLYNGMSLNFSGDFAEQGVEKKCERFNANKHHSFMRNILFAPPLQNTIATNKNIN